MGTVPISLARSLRRRLGLEQAVETGTWVGNGALLLSDVFPRVTTIELSEEYARNAAEILRDEPIIEVINGDSRAVLTPSRAPTFYFLDGHWSGGDVAEDDQCPLLDEFDAIAGGHADDCIVIDDARLYADPPPAGHRVDQWPRLDEVERRLALHWPNHNVVVAHDQIVAVPNRAADLAEEWAAAPFEEPERDASLITRLRRKRWQFAARRGPARTRPARRARG